MGNIMARLAEVTVTAPTVNVSDYTETVKTMLGSIFTVDNLVTIIVAGLSLCAGLFIFWFAYRFIKRRVEKALKKGSL